VKNHAARAEKTPACIREGQEVRDLAKNGVPELDWRSGKAASEAASGKCFRRIGGGKERGGRGFNGCRDYLIEQESAAPNSGISTIGGHGRKASYERDKGHASAAQRSAIKGKKRARTPGGMKRRRKNTSK